MFIPSPTILYVYTFPQNLSLHSSLSNRHWMLSRKRSESESNDSEPLNLHIRAFGGHLAVSATAEGGEMQVSTLTASAAIWYEMSRRSLCPKLYGFFPGGQVEEHVLSHTLSAVPSDAHDPEVIKLIAQAMGTIHSMNDLAIPKGIVIWNAYTSMWRAFQSKVPKCGDNPFVKKLIASKWHPIQIIDWLKKVTIENRMRINTCFADWNHLNVLVREESKEPNEKGEESKYCKVLVTDYEVVQTCFRGFDFGNFFFNYQKVFDDLNRVIHIEHAPITIEEKREFLEHYQARIKSLNVWNDFDEQGLDSIDHLFLEAAVGEVMYALWVAMYALMAIEKLGRFPAWHDMIWFIIDRCNELMRQVNEGTYPH